MKTQLSSGAGGMAEQTGSEEVAPAVGVRWVSIAWLAAKVILIVLAMNSARTIFVYQNF